MRAIKPRKPMAGLKKVNPRHQKDNGVRHGTPHHHFFVSRNTVFGLRFGLAVYTGYLRLMI